VTEDRAAPAVRTDEPNLLGAPTPSTPTIVREHGGELTHRARWWTSRAVIYGLLILWAVVCLFPIYWTITTSFKTATDVTQGRVIPFVDYQPQWLGWRTLGLSPDTIGTGNTSRDEFFKRFGNTAILSLTSSTLAVVLGSLTGYGLSRFGYRFLWLRNQDISFFFLSQLILPPVVLALPFLVLYRELGLLDSLFGLVMLYTLTVLPIVIWIMRDQFMTIPTELEEAALVDGDSIWGAFRRIIVPIALPGMIASFILALVLTWNEFFFASLLSSSNSKTLPLLVASQTGSQGISWWSMAAVSFASIVPLVIVGILLERWIVKGIVAGAVK
jgi:multiple sugar transport system permease protein